MLHKKAYFDKAVELFKLLEWHKGVIMDTKTFVFIYKDIEFAIVHNKHIDYFAAGKVATDVRLLQHDKEVNEPFKKTQVGSSVMAYKQNPMQDERLSSLARYKLGSTAHFRATNEDFLAIDAIMELVLSTFVDDTPEKYGFTVNPEIVRADLEREMPFFITDEVIALLTKRGADRGKVHEVIRDAALEASRNVRAGKKNNFFDLLAEKHLPVDLVGDNILDPIRYIGRAREQIDEFNKNVVAPITKRYEKALSIQGGVLI